MKINNFRKQYHSYAQAIKNQDYREEESKNEKKTVDLANEQSKQILLSSKNEGNEMLMKMMVITIQQLVKSIEVV